MFTKVKEGLKKIGQKIKEGFEKIINWFKDHGREVVSEVAKLGVCSIIFAIYKTLGASLTPFEYKIGWIGVGALMVVLEHATGRYINDEMDDIFDSAAYTLEILRGGEE